MNIEVFRPYVNFLEIDGGVYPCHWCHGTFARAMEIYRMTTNEDTSFEELLVGRAGIEGTLSLVIAALERGGMKDAFTNVTVWASGNIETFVQLMDDGLDRYFPEIDPEDIIPEIPEEDLDMSYPDTVQHDMLKKVDMIGFFEALTRAGIPPETIENMTLRGTLAFLE